MTSATLFREGTDLDELLAELDAEYPGQVHVVEVNHMREGGVFGFFARPRVAVEYTLDASEPVATGAVAAAVAAEATHEPGTSADTDPLGALIAAAEMVETGQLPVAAAGEGRTLGAGPVDAETPGGGQPGNVEFARMLLDIAARKNAERAAQRSTRTTVTATGAAERGPGGDTLPTAAGGAPEVAPHRSGRDVTDGSRPVRTTPTPDVAPGRPTVESRLALRRRLTELGVPIEAIPADAVHRYAAVEQLVARLPEPAPLPDQAGTVVVVAGPRDRVGRTARLLAHRMGIAPGAIWTFGCPQAGGAGDRRLIEVADARALAAATRRADTGGSALPPVLVALAYDPAGDTDSDDLQYGADGPAPTAAQLVAALEPDAFWLHVDATRKPADIAREVRELGAPTALVVSGAGRTGSPASVWHLGVPVAVLDGRPATRSAWAVLLLDRLAEAEHGRAGASQESTDRDA